MSENKDKHVYFTTAKDKKNYITSVEADNILFGKKEEALSVTQKDANTLQRILHKHLGNGHIEDIN